MDLDTLATTLVDIGKGTPMLDGKYPRAFGQTDFPDLVSQGDCPQLVHIFAGAKPTRQTFGAAVELTVNEYTFNVYFLYQPFALGSGRDAAPAILRFVGNYLKAIAAHDTLLDDNQDPVAQITVIASGAGNYEFNGVMFRGIRFEVKVKDYS